MIGQGPIRDNDPRTAALELQQQIKVDSTGLVFLMGDPANSYSEREQ